MHYYLDPYQYQQLRAWLAAEYGEGNTPSVTLLKSVYLPGRGQGIVHAARDWYGAPWYDAVELSLSERAGGRLGRGATRFYCMNHAVYAYFAFLHRG